MTHDGPVLWKWRPPPGPRLDGPNRRQFRRALESGELRVNDDGTPNLEDIHWLFNVPMIARIESADKRAEEQKRRVKLEKHQRYLARKANA